MLLINVISLLRGEENDGNVNDIFAEALRVREELKSKDENVAGQQLVVVEPNVVWHHSQPISDKGSLFVASGVAICDISEVANIVNFHANKDSKHRKATHHMYAYRLLKDGIVYHDNADDGEDGAGRKIAELLANMMKAEATANERQQGVVLIVSRWYGGTLLGPKRFAHIASAAREVMLQMGYGC